MERKSFDKQCDTFLMEDCSGKPINNTAADPYFLIDTILFISKNVSNSNIFSQDHLEHLHRPHQHHCHLLHNPETAEMAVNCLMKIPTWRPKWIVTILFPQLRWIAVYKRTNDLVKVRLKSSRINSINSLRKNSVKMTLGCPLICHYY